MKNLLAFFLMAIISATSFGQDLQSVEFNDSIGHHYVGLNAGASTGLGFSYKYLKNKWGIQATGIPVFLDDEIYTSLGLQVTRRLGQSLKGASAFNFNLYAGIHHFLESYNDYSYDYLGAAGAEYTVTNQNVNAAVGFGFEYLSSRKLSLNLNAGYGLHLDASPETFFSVEAGIHYRLK